MHLVHVMSPSPNFVEIRNTGGKYQPCVAVARGEIITSRRK